MQVTKTESGIAIGFSVEEIAYLADSLIDPIQHSENVAREKIANCRSRMFTEWLPKLRERGLIIPTDDSELTALILAQPDYKNRAQREADEA